MIKTLKKRFIFVAMVAVTVLLVVLLGAINVLNGVIINEKIDETISFLAQRSFQPEMQIPGIQPDKGLGRNDFFDKPMDEDTFMSSRHFAVLLDGNNQIIRIDVSGISSVEEQQAKEIAQNVIDEKSFYGFTEGFKYSAVISDRMFPAEADSVMIFLDVTDQYANVLSVLLLSVVLGALAWGLMLVLVVFLSSKAIRPIAENMEQQKQFITNAGHEIKTPLAIILANTDALELHNGKNKWSENIRTQTNRLSGLMQNLLLLSKADEGIKTGVEELVDASELLKSVFEPYVQLCEADGKIILADIKDSCFIKAVSENLRQVFSVLVDNAVKYAVPQSNINILLTQQNNKLIFKIKNKCEKLPEAQPSKLFDRFYRGDSARTQKSGGYGIGLSVARAIVEGCNGKILCAYLDDNIIEFTVEI